MKTLCSTTPSHLVGILGAASVGLVSMLGLSLLCSLDMHLCCLDQSAQVLFIQRCNG